MRKRDRQKETARHTESERDNGREREEKAHNGF